MEKTINALLFVKRIFFAVVDYCKNDGYSHMRCPKCARLKQGACWYVSCPRHDF